jgi:hypothetical protein
MLTSTYKNAQWLRIATFLLSLLLLGLTSYKLYSSLMKMHDYSKAKASAAEKNVIAAEEFYDKASRNSWIQYKNIEIEQALSDLKPVTEIKASLQNINEQNDKALKNNDLKALLDSYASYQTMRKESAAKGGNYSSIFTDMIPHFDMENQFKDAFAESKDKISKDLQAGMKKKLFTDELVISFLQIPAEFFGTAEQRQAEIQNKLEPYDLARIDLLAKDKKFAEVLTEGVRLHKLYLDLKVQPNWLLPKIEQYAQNQMASSMEKNDIASFVQDAKKYEETKELAVSGSKVLAYIQSTFNKQIELANQLANDQKYKQAIEAFASLASYQDTGKQIQDIELKWAANEPNHILEKVYPDQAFSNVINGKDQLGALIYAVGISEGKLVLARMFSDMSMDKKDAAIDKNFKAKGIRVAENISVQGAPVLVLEGSSTARKSRYVAFEVQASGLRKVFDLEADGYQIDRPGTMVVDNAIGEGAGQKAFYEFRNGAYNFVRIKPDYVDISLADLHNYKNIKVRFTCSVLAADDNTAVVMYNGEYILLTGSSKLHAGNATVIGTWVSNDEIKKGNQSISAYKINVFSATQ